MLTFLAIDAASPHDMTPFENVVRALLDVPVVDSDGD